MSFPTYDTVPPSILPVIPSVLPPAPSANDANGDKWPRDIAPATKSQQNTPVSSGNQCFIFLPCRMGIILYIPRLLLMLVIENWMMSYVNTLPHDLGWLCLFQFINVSFTFQDPLYRPQDNLSLIHPTKYRSHQGWIQKLHLLHMLSISMVSKGKLAFACWSSRSTCFVI